MMDITVTTVVFVMILRVLIIVSMYNCMTEIFKLCRPFLCVIYALGFASYIINTTYSSVQIDISSPARMLSLFGLTIMMTVLWHIIRTVRKRYVKENLCQTRI